MKRKNARFRRKWILPVISILIAVILLMAFWNRNQNLTEQLEALQGGSRQADAAETAFFRAQLEDLVPPGLTEAELSEKTLQYMNDVNAAFFLGSRLGICSPFTLADFSAELDAENVRRARMAETGEVFFGPDRFDLRSYFNYRYSTLMSSLSNWLIENRDADLTDRAREFYKEQKDSFRELVRVDYELTDEQGTEEYSVQPEDFRLLERQDSELLEALSRSGIGERCALSDGRSVRKIHEEYEQLSFEQNEEYVLQAYLMSGGLQSLIRAIASGNPVTLP